MRHGIDGRIEEGDKTFAPLDDGILAEPLVDLGDKGRGVTVLVAGEHANERVHRHDRHARLQTMAGGIADQNDQCALIGAKEIVIVAAGHDHRPVADHAHLRGLVTRGDAIAAGRPHAMGNDRFLQAADAVHFLAQPRRQLARFLGMGRRHRRRDAREHQENEVAAVIAIDIETQTMSEEARQGKHFARPATDDHRHTG